VGVFGRTTGLVWVEGCSAEGDGGIVDTIASDSKAVSGGWTTSFAAPAASAPSPRCLAATG
jgi:hypothetical protein